MRAAALWLAGALVLTASGPASADVADFLGKSVAIIRVEIEGRPTADPRVLGLIETLSGSALSMRDVRESVTHLFSLGRFEDVRVVADPVEGGVRLIYELVPLHPIRKIQFAGAMTLPGIDVGRLERAVSERYGASPPSGRRFDLARVAEEDLSEHGYLHAVVTPRLEIAHDPDRATLILAVAPGDRTHIGEIQVVGSAGAASRQVLERLGIRTGAAYERNALNTRIQEYQQSQWDSGHVEAKLTLTTRFENGDRLVHLVLSVNEGPRVKVIFNGDSIPRDKHDELVPIAEEASADEDLLEDSSNRIVEYLQGLGYRDASAPHVRQEVNGELLVTFTIAKGPLYRVSEVRTSGNRFESLSELLPRLGVRAGQPLSDATLEADRSAIESFYQREGFAAVRVSSLVDLPNEPPAGDVPVVVRIEVTEGVRTVVNTVRIQGNGSVPDADLLQGLGLQPGRPFFLTQMAVDRDTMQLSYANRGYQSATITGNPGISSDGSRAEVLFTVVEGPQLRVDHVLIVGNARTQTETIEREVQIKAGDPLGLAAIGETQRRLAELGLFRRVRISQISHGDETTRDLVVTLEESPVTTVGYGGGLEALSSTRTDAESGAAVEQLQIAPRAFFEIGRRNLFGKNRSINLFARISFRPEPGQSTADTANFGFKEYRVFGAFREPRLFNTEADAFLTGTIEQQSRSSFNFSRRAFNAEIGRRVTPTVSFSGNYQIQYTELFDENIAKEDKLLIDRLFPQLVLSSFSISGVRTTKDDAVNATEGRYFSANGQLAAQKLGSDVGFVKSFLTAQLFRTLPRSRRTVLALSGRLGTAYGFRRTLPQTDEQGNPILTPDGQPIIQIFRDLPASERFFAGGDTTVRGFALDQLGTTETLDQNGFAIGGNAVVILNAELRVPLFGGLGLVGFLDAGNVFARTSDIDFGRLRSAVGFGFRYRSPVGPIRVDMGFKTRRYEVVPGHREEANSLHISLGQAF